MSTPASRQFWTPWAGAVRRRELPVAARLVGHRLQFRHGVRRAVGIGRPGRAAGGHDLDVVRALLEELPHLRSHGDLAVGLGAEVAHVAAGDGDRAAADDHPGPGGELPADALAEGEGDPALGPVLPERGHPRGGACARSWRPGAGGCRRPPWPRRRRACRRRARPGGCARPRGPAGSSPRRSRRETGRPDGASTSRRPRATTRSASIRRAASARAVAPPPSSSRAALSR